MVKQYNICQCRRCSSETCWADVEAGNEFMEEAIRRAEAAEARVERLRREHSEIRAAFTGHVRDFYRLCAEVAKRDPAWIADMDGKEPDPADNEFRESYDPWEGLSNIDAIEGGKAEVERLKAKLAKAREALERGLRATSAADTFTEIHEALAAIDDETEG